MIKRALKNEIEEYIREIPKFERAKYLKQQIQFFKIAVKYAKSRTKCSKLNKLYEDLEEIVDYLER